MPMAFHLILLYLHSAYDRLLLANAVGCRVTLSSTSSLQNSFFPVPTAIQMHLFPGIGVWMHHKIHTGIMLHYLLGSVLQVVVHPIL